MNNSHYLERGELKNRLLNQEKLNEKLSSLCNELRNKCFEQEEKIKSQRAELKRLNNMQDRAKEFANDVLAEIYINKDNYIQDLEIKLNIFRRKEKYYEEKINELLTEINKLRGNNDE